MSHFMNTPSYTLVVGVDARHLQQLGWTWPTWRRHKPELLGVPMLAFRDGSVTDDDVRSVVDHPDLMIVEWPPVGPAIDWGSGVDKWTDPQRVKMISGFVHVPARYVETVYWLKLDCDVVATGRPDWIDPSWFDGYPAIVAHRWSFTKPPDQIDRLDEWAVRHNIHFPTGPLELHPEPGADRRGHKRIISWCGFFHTAWTRTCSMLAAKTSGLCRLPVGSQDGFVWYVARRFNEPIVRVDMKARGWQQWSTDGNVREKSLEAMR